MIKIEVRVDKKLELKLAINSKIVQNKVTIEYSQITQQRLNQ